MSSLELKLSAHTAYTSKDLLVLIPTKDRPKGVRNLLASLAEQTEKPGRIILVDGGESVEGIVQEFRNKLNIDYMVCRPPGQIRQRINGLEKADKRTPLVAFVDDEVIFESNTVEAMIAFWNNSPAETGGVGFTIVNIPAYRYSMLRALIGMSGPQGAVLKSGYNVPIISNRDFQSAWLGGGYSVWRLAVLREFPQVELKTRWAIGEDVRFSYPIGKIYPLFVSASSKIHDQGQTIQLLKPGRARFNGRKEALAYLYLVEQHPELSMLRCIFMIAIRSFILLFIPIFNKSRSVHRAIGFGLSLIDFVKCRVAGRSIKTALED